MREDYSRDVLVRDFVIFELFSTEESIGESASSGDGDRGQQSFALNVSNRRTRWERLSVGTHRR